MDRVRDICYCAYEDCKRNCERNTALHDFRGQIMTQSLFNTVEGWTEDTCEYFMEKDDKPLTNKQLNDIIDSMMTEMDKVFM